MFNSIKRYRRVVGVDLGSACAKVVVFEEAGESVQVMGYGLAEVQEDRRLEALQQALKSAGSPSGRVVTAVSGRSVTVRYVTMPAMPDADLKTALPMEADKYMPYDVAELYLDGQKLAIGGNEQEMRVLMVSAKKTLIQEHVALLAQAGLAPAVVDVDAFALGNSYELAGDRQEGEVAALVDIGATKTSINIVKGTVSCFTREVYVGGRDFTEVIAKRLGIDPAEAETLKRNPGDRGTEILDAVTSVAEDLGNEIRLSFDYFESQFEDEVQNVKLSGGGARLAGLDNLLQGVFGKSTAPWDPVSKLALVQGMDAAGFKDNAAQYAVAIGLAARIRVSVQG